MKTLLKNFISVLYRFKIATALNILGLSVSFAVFILIMIQLDYDWNFAGVHANSDRIYRLETKSGDGAKAVLSRPLAEAFIESSPHIEAGSICGFWGKNVFSVDAHGEKNIYEEELVIVRPGFTKVFEFNMLYGSDEALEYPESILISQTLSEKMFGKEPAIGKTVYMDTTILLVGGVYKDFPDNTLLKNGIYKPLPFDTDLNSWGNIGYQCYIKVDLPENRRLLIDNFKKNFDSSLLDDGYKWILDTNYRLTPLTEVHFSNDVSYDGQIPKTNRQTLYVLFAIAVIIILIAAINYTNFSTALAPIRLKSINTQKILGSKLTMIRLSLLAEAVFISFLSFLISLMLVSLTQFTPIASLMDVVPSLHSSTFIIVITLLISLLTGCLAGIYPAYYITSFSPAIVLKGSYVLSPNGRKLRSSLIGMQYLASFVLIIGAIFMYLQNTYMRKGDMGYNKDRLIVTNLSSPILTNIKSFTNQIKSLAEIENVSFSHALISSQDQYWGLTRPYLDQKIKYECLVVDPSFPDLLNIPVIEGRNFSDEDLLKKRGTLIFNESARKAYQLKLGDKVDESEIIGFMPDIKFASFRTAVVPMAFWVGGHRETAFAYIKVKAGADEKTALNKVNGVLNVFDKGYPFNIRFFDEIFKHTYSVEYKLGALVLLFSLIVIFISLVGVFGLVIFESEYRKKEIGIRKVLGSTVREIVILFNKSYMRIITLCFIPAVPLSYFMITKWLENFAYKTPLHWWVFVFSFVLIAFITSLTVTFQNWRTANSNPLEIIKTE